MSEASRNKHYQRDIKYIMLFTRKVLIALGAWPSADKGRSVFEKIYKYLLIAVTYIIISCSLIPGALFWIVETRTRVRLRTMVILIYSFLTVTKYSNLLFYEGNIKRCLRYIEEDWRKVVDANERNMMLESARKSRRLIVIIATFLYSNGFVQRVLVPLSRRKIVTAHNVTIRPLPSPTYLFSVDTQASPIYEILYTIQCLSGLISMSIGASTCGLMILLVMHACGQLKILMGLMRNLVEKRWQEELEVEERLSGIVEQQARIRNFLHLVEQTLQQICLVDILGGTIIGCIVGYCLIMEWENSNGLAMYSYLITLFTVFINSFMFCYTGEQLVEQILKTTGAYLNVLRSII